MASQTAAIPFGAVAELREASLVQKLYVSFVEWNEKRATRKLLLQLTDRELEDIGLVRSDLT